jgi:hypothetical protein
MITKKVSLFYIVYQNSVKIPDSKSVQRKENWIRQIQKTVQSAWEPKLVKVTYELFNPEIDRMRRFFNGPVVLYYAIQNQDIISGEVPNTNGYREELLDDTLGYDVRLPNRTVRKRKSTSEFISVQQWNDFLATLKETQFDNAGYEFPESEEFWKLEEQYGYENAKTISIKKLQERVAKRLSTRNVVQSKV